MKFFDIIDRYILKNFFISFILCGLIFFSIWLIWDMSTNLSDFVHHKESIHLIPLFYITQLPAVIMLGLPVVLLLSLLYTFIQLSRYHEIISMFASGRSLLRIFFPLFLILIPLTIILLFFNYSLAPHAMQMREKIKEEAKYQTKKITNYYEKVLFYYKPGYRIWFISQLYADRNELVNVEIIQQNEDNCITDKWYAHQVIFLPEESIWILKDVRHIQFDDTGLQVVSEFLPQLKMNDWQENISKIDSIMMKADFMGWNELDHYLQVNSDMSDEKLAPFLTHWHYRLALPSVLLIILLIGGSSGLVIGKKHLIANVSLSFILFTSLIFMSNILLAFGEGNKIPAWIAVWAPVILFLLIGIFLFFRKSCRGI